MVCLTPVARGSTENPKRLLHGVHVLVVDDERDPRELFRDVLVLAGARVTMAASAREALAAIEQEPPDVLVSDIMMPGEDGYWLIEAIRAARVRTGSARAGRGAAGGLRLQAPRRLASDPSRVVERRR